MRTTAIWGLISIAALSLWAADKPQSLNVRLGLWEITRTTSTSGEMPVPRELLQKLSPEQRARLNDRMNARSTETTRKTTTKYCLTAQRLNQGIPFDQDGKACTRTVVSSSRTKIEVRKQCTDGTIQTDEIRHIERLNSENVKGDSHSLCGR